MSAASQFDGSCLTAIAAVDLRGKHFVYTFHQICSLYCMRSNKKITGRQLTGPGGLVSVNSAGSSPPPRSPASLGSARLQNLNTFCVPRQLRRGGREEKSFLGGEGIQAPWVRIGQKIRISILWLPTKGLPGTRGNFGLQ